MLIRLSQLGRKIESVEGVEESLVATDFRGNFKEQDFSQEITRYEREVQKSTLDHLASIAGHRIGKITFMEELVGGGAATVAPWHTTIRGMGFVAAGLKVMSLGTVTNGPFFAGQTIGNNATQGSATVTGVAVLQIAGSPVKLVYRPVTGAFDDTMSVYNYAVSQASAEVNSAPADAGYSLLPFSETDASKPATLTVERRIGGYRHTLIGARGTGGLTLRQSEPWLLRAEFDGPAVLDTGNPGRFRTGSAITGIASFGTAPKVGKGIPLTLRDGSTSWTPIMLELPFELNNTLARRATIANNDLADSGYLATMITDRRFSVNIDPERVVAGTFDLDAVIHLGRAISITGQVGLPSDVNGALVIHAPAAVASGALGFGDRDGVMTQPGEFMLTGVNGDDELQIHHVFVA